MKNLLLIILFLSFSGLLAAQGNSQLKLGEKQLNFGPLYAGIEFGIKENITIGGVVNYDWGSYDQNTNTYFNSIDFIGKIDYHLGEILQLDPQWDLYGGVRTGFGAGKIVTFLFGFEVGGRWFWNDKWGINVESSYGNGLGGGVGLTMKLN